MKKYYIRRGIALLPLYYLAAILYNIFISKESLAEKIMLFPIEFLGIQTVYNSILDYSHNSGTWFISCLIICYLIYPFIQEMFKQLAIRGKLLVITLCAFILLYSEVVVIGFKIVGIYHNPFFRCLEFIIGVGLATIMEDSSKKKGIFTWRLFWFECVSLFGLVTVIMNYYQKLGNIFEWIGLPVFSLMIITLYGVDIKNKYLFKIIVYMSSITYTFFLAQFFTWPITRYVVNYIGLDSVHIMRITLFVSMSICLSISILFYELYQKRIGNYLKIKFM